MPCKPADGPLVIAYPLGLPTRLVGGQEETS